MPQPVRGGQRYMPGLDGLRALAVLAVIFYHVQFGWAQGGVLGVGVFFTLSGYLITDLLLGAWSATGRLPLADFWVRRARRLLPALFVVLVVVTIWVALFNGSRIGQLRGALAAAALYVSNWWLIFQHTSYFSRFGPPSPLGHLWSLAVEEQFYLLWPWLLWLAMRYVVWWPRRRVSFRGLAAATLVLAAASATAMALLYHPGTDPTRIYEGTDTRAFGLLAGAALAMVWPSRRVAAGLSARAGAILDGAGAGCLILIALLVWRTSEYSAFLYQGGIVLLTAATMVVLAAVASGNSRLGRALGCKPLRWLGVRSYGTYLWHYPVIALTTSVESGETLLRATLQVAASISLAALSWKFVEEPVRRGTLRTTLTRAWSAWSAPASREASTHRWAYVGVLGLAAVVLLPCPGLAGFDRPVTRYFLLAAPPGPGTVPTVQTLASSRGASASRPPAGNGPAASMPPAGGPATSIPPAGGPAASGSHAGNGATADEPAGVAEGRPALSSSCRAVVHIGDSTSDGLVSPDYLPDPAQRITAQYARVGAVTQHMDIVGGTSIVETIPGTQNAYQMAQRLVRQGYRGCWVLALGTNDTADVFVGSSLGRLGRIEKMMSLIGRAPVMWVNVKSLVASGPYSRQDMQLWDQALVKACARYPDMRVYDWASEVNDGWFIDDGVHFTSAGYAERGAMIANALARAFPRAGHSAGCLVRLDRLAAGVHRPPGRRRAALAVASCPRRPAIGSINGTGGGRPMDDRAKGVLLRQLDEVEQRLGDADRRVADAEAALKLAERRFTVADQRVGRMEEQLETARSDRDDARAYRYRTRQQRDRAATHAERLRRRVEALRQKIDSLARPAGLARG